MNIKKKFLELTSKTYPYGHEQKMFHLLPDYLKQDVHGNLFYEIGDNNSVMFTCHLDTADSTTSKDVTHVISGNIIKTDGTTILGADDKAGTTVMLFMLENNVPGLYYFFLGEERGCIGSGAVAKTFATDYPNITKVVSFDRRGTTSIITHQSYGRCCSDAFGNDLASKINEVGYINLSNDNTGILTDSAKFMGFIPECTNISVGYQNEHRNVEQQDIVYLIKLCYSVIRVDWNNLVVSRDPSVVESRYSGYSMWSEWGDGDDYYNDFHDRGYHNPKYDYRKSSSYAELFNDLDDEDFFDDDDGLSMVSSWNKKHYTYGYIDGNRYSKIYISSKRIDEEKSDIIRLFRKYDGFEHLHKSDISWDGDTLHIYDNNRVIDTYPRKALCDISTSFSTFYGDEIRTDINSELLGYKEYDEVYVKIS